MSSRHDIRLVLAAMLSAALLSASATAQEGDPVVEALPEDDEELMWELFEEAEEIRLEDEG